MRWTPARRAAALREKWCGSLRWGGLEVWYDDADGCVADALDTAAFSSGDCGGGDPDAHPHLQRLRVHCSRCSWMFFRSAAPPYIFLAVAICLFLIGVIVANLIYDAYIQRWVKVLPSRLKARFFPPPAPPADLPPVRAGVLCTLRPLPSVPVRHIRLPPAPFAGPPPPALADSDAITSLRCCAEAAVAAPPAAVLPPLPDANVARVAAADARVGMIVALRPEGAAEGEFHAGVVEAVNASNIVVRWSDEAAGGPPADSDLRPERAERTEWWAKRDARAPRSAARLWPRSVRDRPSASPYGGIVWTDCPDWVSSGAVIDCSVLAALSKLSRQSFRDSFRAELPCSTNGAGRDCTDTVRGAGGDVSPAGASAEDAPRAATFGSPMERLDRRLARGAALTGESSAPRPAAWGDRRAAPADG
eukprot:gene51483-18083_t